MAKAQHQRAADMEAKARMTDDSRAVVGQLVAGGPQEVAGSLFVRCEAGLLVLLIGSADTQHVRTVPLKGPLPI